MLGKLARAVIRPPVMKLPGVTTVTDKARRVREQLRDGHARDRRMQAADELPGSIVELELAMLAQLHNAGGGEALGMRGDAKAMARSERFAGVQIGKSERALQHHLVAIRNRDQAARLLRGGHLEFEPLRDVAESGFEPAIH